MNSPYFSLIRTVWRNGVQWRHIIVGYYCAYILAQVALGVSPYIFGRAIDVLQNFTPNRLSEVIFWLCAEVAMRLLFWLFHGPARVIERKVALSIQQAFRNNFYEQLTQLSLKWHQDNHSGNIITRANRASTALYKFAEQQFRYIETIVKFLTSIAFLLWVSLPVGLISLCICLLTVFIVLSFDRKLIPLYDAQNEIDNHVGATFFDYVSNMTTILTLRLGELTHSNLFKRMMSMWPHYNKEVVLNEVKWFSISVLLNVMQAVIVITYIMYGLKNTGTIMVGTVAMICRYQLDLSEVFFTLSDNYSDLVRMDTDIKGLQPILNDIKHLSHTPQGASIASQWHTLVIKDLSFYHTGSSSRGKIFNKLTLTIKCGEKIALIGSSGGGKSTLLNLLRGLYTANHVNLTIDGKVPLSSLEPLQSITTLIPQDPEIFANTILFNITMDLLAEPGEINRAVKLAGFSNILATLTEGLDTDIREKGLNFSVGQKQRLALARGLFAARFSSLILMDEPTSSVDLQTEKEILSGVIEAFPGVAMIVSLHRLHLLPKFDRIIMLCHGEIIADGLVVDLLRNPGPVKTLWQEYQNTGSNQF